MTESKRIYLHPHVQTLTSAFRTMAGVTANVNAQTRWVVAHVVLVRLVGPTMVTRDAKVCFCSIVFQESGFINACCQITHPPRCTFRR